MACQPAVEVGIFLSMAQDAFLHVPNLLRQALEVLHLAMTLRTGDFAVNMTLVIKQHVLGHIIDLYPGRWRVGVKIFVFLFYPGMVGDNILMTVQALFNRRDSGMIGVGHVGVAVLALDLFNPAVDIMAERDRLFRSNCAVRRLVK